MRLMMSNHEVSMDGESMDAMVVKFKGPHGSIYAGGLWRVRVELPEGYPYRSPSIGFMDRIYHPNIDEASGSVCLDVINQTWSPMFDLTNIFDSFLPQLLQYPNPSDPMNSEAAALSMENVPEFNKRVKAYVQKYAKDPDYQAELPASSSSISEDEDDDGFFPMS